MAAMTNGERREWEARLVWLAQHAPQIIAPKTAEQWRQNVLDKLENAGHIVEGPL